MNRYPIQLAKVQPPSLRDETLARDRLLDWLNAKIHDRVILVLADAGYGKTTLLADFARRTRLRTLWYRLEEDDRDWIAFLNHLVAAGREHDAGFAVKTASMLSDMSMGGPTRDAAIDTFLRELPAIAAHGTVLILDDFHLVDDSADVRLVARELVTRAPERMSIVFASRRMPTIPLAKLRAAGEVAELGTDDLRFDAEETGRLFSETYGRKLEADVLADVVARTEGWAASLQLVQAALRDRTPVEIRRFIRSLSGADQELYDYLAEEVVGDLDEDLQQFLMRTSILQTVTPELAAVAAEVNDVETSRLVLAAERLTLLARRSRKGPAPLRYHPLVREFLEARLHSSFNEDFVAGIHRRTAEVARTIDWRLAAHHFRAARDWDSVGNVVASAIPEIMGTGQYAAAAEYVESAPSGPQTVASTLVVSRLEMQRGSFEKAIALSMSVLNTTRSGSQESDHALLNLVTMHMHAGRAHQALEFVERLQAASSSSHLRPIAEGMALMIAAGDSGSLDAVAKQLLFVAETQRGRFPHYYGVAMLNLAITANLQDDPRRALKYIDQGIEALGETSSVIELSSALMTKATALTMLGESAGAAFEIDRAAAHEQVEAVLERADLADSFDSPESARRLLEAAESSAELTSNDRWALAMQYARFLSRRGRHDEAALRLEGIDGTFEGSALGLRTARLATAAYIAVAADSTDCPRIVGAANEAARRQGAHGWRHVTELLRAFIEPSTELSSTVSAIATSFPWALTYVADLVAARLEYLDTTSVEAVGKVATLHPARWRFVLRERITGAQGAGAVDAARLLEEIGDRSDIRRLRAFAKHHRRTQGASTLGRGLARRLADRVYVEDQNRVAIRVGVRHVPGSSVRRKVLALLCFLLTKPDLTSTRDQVLEALWPDLDPLDATNSLNQTVYFLRRVLEEEYVDDLSPGYLHHDSDLIWLERDLVTSRSNECRQLVKSLPAVPTPDQVNRLADEYLGRFALDFEYEEWASPYRDWLHASFLEVIERALSSDLDSGHFERGIRLARRVLDVDPTAEQIEVSLLRLYRASGAHAAAAEQYGHYASVIRDQLGVEPQPLESL